MWRHHPDIGSFTVDFVGSARAQHTNKKVLDQLRSGELDIIVHVGMLGEGFDCPTISVCCIFRRFASFSPFAQFVGRAVRRVGIDELNNIAFIVAHPGLGLQPLWDVFARQEILCPSLAELPKRSTVNKRFWARIVRCWVTCLTLKFYYPPDDVILNDLLPSFTRVKLVAASHHKNLYAVGNGKENGSTRAPLAETVHPLPKPFAFDSEKTVTELPASPVPAADAHDVTVDIEDVTVDLEAVNSTLNVEGISKDPFRNDVLGLSETEGCNAAILKDKDSRSSDLGHTETTIPDVKHSADGSTEDDDDN